MRHAEQVSADGAVNAPVHAPAGPRVAGLLHRTALVLLAAVGVVGEGVAVALADPGVPLWNELAVSASVLAYAAVGLLILWHRPDHVVGRLALVLAAVWGVGQALVAASYDALRADPQASLAALGSVAGSLLRGLPWLVAVMWLPLVFPDGRQLDTRLARVAARASSAALGLFAVSMALSPGVNDVRLPRVRNPLGLQGAAGRVVEPVSGLALLLGVVAIGLAVGVLVQRYRRTGALGRQQTLVFAVAFLAPVTGLLLSVTNAADPWVFGLTSVAVPVALGVAVLQRRLYDLPLLANRALTYGILWLMIAALYAVVVGGVGVLAGHQHATWLPWLAAGVVAVTFAPLRAALQQAANRLTYGAWAQPEKVLARTRRRLADVADLRVLLTDLAAELADDLSLEAVEILDAGGSVLAASGPPIHDADELELTAYGEPVGRLRWSRRVLRDADRRFLDDLATTLGAVVHAHALLASVRAAHERVVVAREEERRRLRRDLHDGLGPALAALGLRVDTVRNLLRSGAPEAADADLFRLRSDLQETVADVRRIVEGLRPPALDDLGLVEALRAVLPESVPATVCAEQLPPLPAAVELAAFRIAHEALSNAARHAAAGELRVRLAAEGSWLELEVADDGNGLVAARPGGVGLTSMRERAQEVGGRFEVHATPGQGTSVVAQLPLEA